MRTNVNPMRYLFVVLLIGTMACNTNSPDRQFNQQGLFIFPDELLADHEASPPLNLEESRILCRGRGMKVAKCINDQLKTGNCLGIVKEGRDVFVVQIECEDMREEELNE